jgi:hypothetical protein
MSNEETISLPQYHFDATAWHRTGKPILLSFTLRKDQAEDLIRELQQLTAQATDADILTIAYMGTLKEPSQG